MTRTAPNMTCQQPTALMMCRLLWTLMSCMAALHGAAARPQSPSTLGSASLVPNHAQASNPMLQARIVPVWPHTSQHDGGGHGDDDDDDSEDDDDDDDDERGLGRNVPFVSVSDRQINGVYSMRQQTNMDGSFASDPPSARSQSQTQTHQLRLHLHEPPASIHHNTHNAHNTQHDDTPIAGTSTTFRPNTLKTGTTIAGCIFRDANATGIVLAADTRATEGTMVADKRCEKIHVLASNCVACGAGTSADLDALTRQVLYTLNLHQLQHVATIGNEKSQHAKMDTQLIALPVDIDTICRVLQDALYDQHGNLGANLIVGGMTADGRPELRCLHPHGSMDVALPHAALGSGGLAATSVLECGPSNPTRQQAIDLVARAITSGIRNDLGSGSQVDMCILSRKLNETDSTREYYRQMVPEEEDRIARTSSTTGEVQGNTASVNGFRNLPFQIRSIRRHQADEAMQEHSKTDVWDEVLGL